VKFILLSLAAVAVLAQLIWLGVFLYFFSAVGWCFTCSESAAYLTLFWWPLWLAIEIPGGIVTIIAMAGIIRSGIARRG
jgi:hypothetical protein